MITKHITLAGQRFSIVTPLTLGQLQDLQIGIALPASDDPQEETRRSMRRSVDIILAGLRTEYPDMSAEQLSGMRITGVEVQKSVRIILQIAGLLPEKEDGPGEEKAEAALIGDA